MNNNLNSTALLFIMGYYIQQDIKKDVIRWKHKDAEQYHILKKIR